MNSKKHPPLIEIRTIFPSATGVGILLPEIGKGLVVQFNRQANLFDELEIRNPSKNIFNCSLCGFGSTSKDQINLFCAPFSNSGVGGILKSTNGVTLTNTM